MNRTLSFAAVPVVAAFALTGCPSMSEEDAQATWASIGKSLNNDDGPREQALSIDIAASATFDCRRSGDMDVASNLEADAGDGDLAVAFDYDINYNECRPDDETLDGDLAYRLAFSSVDVEDGRESALTYTYSGIIQVTDENGDVRDCVIDAEGFASSDIDREAGAEFRASREVRYEGSICGHEADSIASVSVDIDA
jgi:hypothetical protein